MLFRGCVLLVFGSVLVQATHNPALDTAWEDWKSTHQKQYLGLDEEAIRRTIWENNMQMIEAHNQEYELGIHTYELGMNHLGDMTKEEVVENMTGFRPDMHVHLNNTFVPESGPVPPSLDYRKKGYVTSVKNQRSCRSCGWAFSAAGALEGRLKKKGKKLVDLSPQNLLDCVKKTSIESNFDVIYAFMYVRDNGIASEKVYPYNGKEDARCIYHNCMKAAKCKDFEAIRPGQESSLTNALVYVGPISVGFDASQPTFHFYKKGVYSDYYCQPDQFNHALLIVGYTCRAWIVKNSWSESWGDGGYIYIEKGRNVCGIANAASYPV
ncbi:hypothetical protein ACEWY4_019887 [Coilia grayii]|uniref:Cystein proteinase inhibitor protein salarin n=1 Tax=Coilia grayii TaxID=363190 RepID=A0ABD1JC78_9TELE